MPGEGYAQIGVTLVSEKNRDGPVCPGLSEAKVGRVLFAQDVSVNLGQTASFHRCLLGGGGRFP